MFIRCNVLFCHDSGLWLGQVECVPSVYHSVTLGGGKSLSTGATIGSLGDMLP